MFTSLTFLEYGNQIGGKRTAVERAFQREVNSDARTCLTVLLLRCNVIIIMNPDSLALERVFFRFRGYFHPGDIINLFFFLQLANMTRRLIC